MKRRPNRWIRVVVNLAIVVALMTALSFLPPDTSLDDRKAAGVLKVCIPPSYPPLVTGDPAQPGFDVELVTAIAERLGLRPQLNVLSSIGSDFNPRNWSLTRGQCDMLAGGLADTVQTRSFLQTIPTPVETGWVGVSASGALPTAGGSVAVLPGTSGLNRLELSSWLREKGLVVVPTRSPQQFADALASGRAEAGITERFVAAAMSLPASLQLFWLPDERFAPQRMALGLWKGDQTLKRAVDNALGEIDSSGQMDEILGRYRLKLGSTPRY